MKSRIQLAGFTALLAAAAATVQAEVKINENLSLDGYAIGSGVVTHGTPATNDVILGKSGGAFDALFAALNGKYNDFSGRFSFMAVNPFDNTAGDASGVLDAYVTYSMGDVSLTAGKYLGYLGYESFHSPNNAFISFSNVLYDSPWATGAKIDYAGEGISAGFSARDSQMAGGSGFNTGDGEYSNDIGYEAYVSFTSIENLTLFAGLGYEKVDGFDSQLTADFWAAYKVTEKLTLAGEFATVEDQTENSWLALASYAVSDELSVAGRVTYIDGKGKFAGLPGAVDAVSYGIASTYTFTPNFSIKAEVALNDPNGGAPDSTSYALQGLFRF